MSKRKSIEITKKEDIDYILNLTEEDLLKTSTVMELFGKFDDKSRFNPYDTIEIPAGIYGDKKNKKFKTTIGLWVFNKVFIEKDFFHLFKYINEPITSKKYNYINDRLGYALLEEEIDLESLKRFILKCQKYQPYVSILSPGYTEEMLTVNEKIGRKKEELVKKYKKELEAGDEITVDKIEKELIEYSKELLKDDPSLDMYDSGARGSFKNQFKNMFIMKGAVKDPDPNKGYNIILSNYMDGIAENEYVSIANSLAAGPYARGKKTEVGGYWEKLLRSAMQHVILGPKDSDCGTKRTLAVEVDEDNIKDIMYSYVVEGDKLTLITYKNKDKFIGKKINIRFTALCESKGYICNKCAGELFSKLNITNIGIATVQIASILKNVSMKSFHDSTVQFSEMDPMKAFYPEGKK